MIRPIGYACFASGLAAVFGSLACAPLEEQGPDTAYRVSGTLTANACAPGFSPLASLDFRVELRREHQNITWRMDQGGPVPGVLDSEGRFRLVTHTRVVAIEPDPTTGVIGCALDQIETVEAVMQSSVDGGTGAGTIDMDAGPTHTHLADAFSATQSIAFVPLPGSDCTLLLQGFGGNVPTLPCQAQYELRGQRP